MPSPIVLPDLGPGEVTFSLWLVTAGDRVFEGDRVAEVLLGAATIDVLSPSNGRLVEGKARPGDTLQPGQTLGWVEEN